MSKKWNTDEEYATLYEQYLSETLSSIYNMPQPQPKPSNLLTDKEIMDECVQQRREHYKEVFGIYPEEFDDM